MVKQKVFIDEELNKQFEQEGYIIINDFLEDQEIETLKEACHSFDSKVGTEFYTSFWSPDKAYRLKTHNLISEVMMKKTKKLLIEYFPLVCDFFVKHPGKNSDLGLHQDWKFVDEPDYTSVVVWCPLVETNEANGAIELIKRSHLFFEGPRGANIPPRFHEIKDYVARHYLTPAYLKPGQAIIFDHRIIHGSKPNFSEYDRLAAGMIMAPEQASLFHYHYNRTTGHVHKINVPRDYFQNYNYNADFIEKLMLDDITLPPWGNCVDKIPYTIPSTSKEEFDNLYAKFNHPKGVLTKKH